MNSIDLHIFPDKPPKVSLLASGAATIELSAYPAQVAILLGHLTDTAQVAWLEDTAALLTDLAAQVKAYRAEQAS